MRTSELFVEQNLRFFENYGESTRTRGVETVRAFFGHGGVNFLRFLARLRDQNESGFFGGPAFNQPIRAI